MCVCIQCLRIEGVGEQVLQSRTEILKGDTCGAEPRRCHQEMNAKLAAAYPCGFYQAARTF
eukprot:scaffold40655_cov16-Prasinocladus_malaysianus.AAC.1